MALRVLVVPDKFKGTLTSAQAGAHIAAAWGRKRRDDAVTILPMSDGGDGFGEVLGDLLGARRMECETVDAAGHRRVAAWWWDAGSGTAIVESAQAVGLALLPPGKFHPFDLDTRGVAPLLRAAASQGAKSILVGIGGSATNDGGFGMARGLGWRFLEAGGREITRWTNLVRAGVVQAPEGTIAGKLTVAVDVNNPLLGTSGASRIYGPQKGLRAEDFEEAERCLERLAQLMARHRGDDVAVRAGAGAAGGLGFGMMAFMGADVAGGFDLFAGLARLDERIRGVDLVITGEGCIDQSTLMGKGVGGVASRCERQGRPCLGLAGVLGTGVDPSQPGAFAQVCAMAPDLATPEAARREPGLWLERLTERVAEDLPDLLSSRNGAGASPG